MNRGAIPPMIDVIIHSHNLNHGVVPRIGKWYKWNRSAVPGDVIRSCVSIDGTPLVLNTIVKSTDTITLRIHDESRSDSTNIRRD